MDSALLGHGEVGPEVCLHGQGCDFVLLLFDCGLVGQSMHSRTDLLLRSRRVLEDVTTSQKAYFSLNLFLISASLSTFCLPASIKTVVLESGLA